MLLRPLLLAVLACGLAAAKVYDRCELARELRQRHGVPADEVATWVCIARHESDFNTTAVGHVGEGGDHGIFQVSDIYWCSHSGPGKACGLSCAQLLDDDITDDFACVRKIQREHKGLSGNGFSAWAVYPRYCKGPKAAKYVEGCFGGTGNEIAPQAFYGLPPPAITAPPPPARHRPRPVATTTPAPPPPPPAVVGARSYGLPPATPRPYARWFAPAPASVPTSLTRSFAVPAAPARAAAPTRTRAFAPVFAPAATPAPRRPASDPSHFWNWQFLPTRRWF